MSDDLELRIEKEDVIGFFRDSVPALADEFGLYRHYNFYVNPIFNPKIFCQSAASKTELSDYRGLTSSLDGYYKQEETLFRGMMDAIKRRQDVSNEAATLFDLYVKIIDAANKIKQKFESSPNKHHTIKSLIESINSYVKAREKMYNPATRYQYLKSSQ